MYVCQGAKPQPPPATLLTTPLFAISSPRGWYEVKDRFREVKDRFREVKDRFREVKDRFREVKDRFREVKDRFREVKDLEVKDCVCRLGGVRVERWGKKGEGPSCKCGEQTGDV